MQVEPYLMENPSFRHDAEWYGGGGGGGGGSDGSTRHGNGSTHGTAADYRYTDEDQEYVGYIADLISKLSEIIGFDYEIRPTLDGSYGFEKPDGSWDGIIGDVLAKV